MEPRDRLRPERPVPGASLEEVQRAIERLPREDRATLRPWILARFDVRGYPASGVVRSPEARPSS
jgi:hypothetical protein